MIVVASHVNYQKAWDTLKHSFRTHGVSMKDVIVVVAGSTSEDIIVQGPDTEVYITVPYNFYEYTAVYGVSKFIDHERVKDTAYVLIHDTSIAMDGFAQAAVELCKRVEQEGLELLFLTESKQLNQVVLSYDFIKTYGHHYGITAGKDRAWHLEHGQEGSFISYANQEKVRNTNNKIRYLPAIKYMDSDILRHPVMIEPLRLLKLVANNDEGVNPPWQKRTYP